MHAALLEATGVTEDSRSKIDLLELVSSTVLALQVTRSAYLYLIDLVAMWNHPDDHQGTYLPFLGLRYFNDRTVEHPTTEISAADEGSDPSPDGEVGAPGPA
ncbi:hypothetical protein [Jiangella alba]|uniref:Uncharacterized protein n=1 Tax=Jiangella alba TaxID=561176 RepID=A0A1H5JJ06_9ACTN|nr:hypothetical protein [Jiangella alba]SEE52227.1 hypothetical protein SAMN04488561_1597 [Jiangella alba]